VNDTKSKHTDNINKTEQSESKKLESLNKPTNKLSRIQTPANHSKDMDTLMSLD
jgi:hypothetical protein